VHLRKMRRCGAWSRFFGNAAAVAQKRVASLLTSGQANGILRIKIDEGLLSPLRRTSRNGSTNAIPFGEPNSVILGDRSIL
jgi:hypothetical protein